MSILLDTTNLYRCVRRKFGDEARLMYEDYVNSIENLFGPQETRVAYVSKPQKKAVKFADYLRELDFRIHFKTPREIEFSEGDVRRTTDFIAELCVDALQHAKKDETLVIGSSDYRLEYLLKKLQRRAGMTALFAVGIPAAFKAYASTKEIESILIAEHPDAIKKVSGSAAAK